MRLFTTQVLRLLPCFFLICLSSACTLIRPVQAWEKGTLARQEMSLTGDKLDNRISEHIYTSREAASGGASVGGGGCGCN
ncbi:DUF4266 domain-containing protein [Undibacterium sp. Jales W-56]|uniref:DUF4266 domain-containing protein n=1 Tax=Undibacterium sp. Jales W-56 TaxID=2897325 RepID=UPI0021CE12AE|nr:DUF4266 domain-containing protein [Undibacterium sp. Jales W-56]MCU6434031.1 DUF4266 domain-containing protein [Undibacterium sp. Jales W-56]